MRAFGAVTTLVSFAVFFSAGAMLRADEATWWSFRKPVRPRVPALHQREWIRTPVDAFVLAALEARGLQPAPLAERAVLIRRLTYDLLGLPPTPAEIDAFVRDVDPLAYEKLIDRLLASPQYGERWARHWLDVVHYGDTHGYDKDKRRDYAWPYRDYVIRSLNEDKPYSRFVEEQVAGDVLFPHDANGIIATGFIVAGPWDFVGHVELREGTVDKLKARLLDRDDMLANTFSTFQSLTVHCARCHDHKFDPIGQKDYYRLQAVFAGVERGNRAYAIRNRLPHLVYAATVNPPRPIHELHRGSVEQPRKLAVPGTLEAITELPFEFRDARPEHEGGRRAALALWLTEGRNPLTRRSIVNRVWHYHFGRGLVDTPNDFGKMGSTPTHPSCSTGWRAGFSNVANRSKNCTGLFSIVQSTGSRLLRFGFAKTDATTLSVAMNRQRLDAESIRDAVLAISASWTYAGGRRLVRFKDDHSPVYDHMAIDKTTIRKHFAERSILHGSQRTQSFLDFWIARRESEHASSECGLRRCRRWRRSAIRSCSTVGFLPSLCVVRIAISPPKSSTRTLMLGRRPDPAGWSLTGYVKVHGLAQACHAVQLGRIAFID